MADGKLDPIKIQAEIDNSEARWQAGITSVSELSKEEQDIRLGYVPGPDEESLEVREQIAETNLKTFQEEGMMAYGYPISYDLRNVGGKNYITPIKNQGGCGSCVAFGTAATVEGTIRKKRNDPNLNIDLSEAHLFYCIAKSQGRNCSNGWWVGPAMDGCKNTGVVDEDCYPYTAGDQNCNLCGDWQKRTQKISGWHEIRNVAKMKDWLSNHGPLAACFTVYADFYSYRSGIYKHVTGEKRGGHCVCCVGYNDSQKYWIMKNSWGSGWGESGYFKISYGQCGIEVKSFFMCKNIFKRRLSR